MTNNKGHIPVLSKEVISYLRPKGGDAFIDATIGLGGHSEEILKKIGKTGELLGIDRDEEALRVAEKNLQSYKRNLTVVNVDFRNIEEIAEKFGFKDIAGIILDLGVSSFQLDAPERGFSFRFLGPLDMRMDRRGGLTASDIVNGYAKENLEKIFKEYGEERFSKRIAQAIVEERKIKKIETTKELREIIIDSLPTKYTRSLKIDPATKIFQALRIEVNDELSALKEFLPQAVSILKKGGRLTIISFHSLEDRIVKEFFKTESKGCICPKDFPVCRCGKTSRIKILTKKPVMPGIKEIRINPRARSAKMRVVERI